jgi:hypothetical protein
MTNAAQVLAVAAVVYDQETHSEADLAFLDAMAKADREWLDQLSAANINFGGGSEAWQAVKRLATRSRNDAYARALVALEANDDEFLQAAE